jgi:hypothetical protein
MLSEEHEREQLGENLARQAASTAKLLSEVEAEASAIGLTSPPDILRGENSRAQGLRDTPRHETYSLWQQAKHN